MHGSYLYIPRFLGYNIRVGIDSKGSSWKYSFRLRTLTESEESKNSNKGDFSNCLQKFRDGQGGWNGWIKVESGSKMMTKMARISSSLALLVSSSSYICQRRRGWSTVTLSLSKFVFIKEKDSRELDHYSWRLERERENRA
jgi:hypothetical protein